MKIVRVPDPYAMPAWADFQQRPQPVSFTTSQARVTYPTRTITYSASNTQTVIQVWR